MQSHAFIIILPWMLALAAALLAWFLMDTGTQSLSHYRAQFTQQASFQLKEFFLFIDASRLFMMNLGLMIVGGTLAWIVTGSAWIALALFFICASCPRLFYSWMRYRRQQQFEMQLPDALMILAGSLRSGSGLTHAIQHLVVESPAPLSQEFTLLIREQRLGISLEQSFHHLSRRMPTPSTVLVVSAIKIASETGGGLAETLERTSQTIRSRLQMEGKIKALTSQGKMQAWIVGLLPVFLLIILNRMEPEAMHLLWNSRMGWGTLSLLVSLECMGIYVIRKIIRIDV